MSYNGSGVYTLPAGSLHTDGQTIDAADVNTPFSDIEAAFNEVLLRNGAAAASGNLPMGTNKLTNLGAGSARADSVQLGQVQDGKLNWAVAGGTADALTLSLSPAITALVDGQEVTFRAATDNTTTTPTLSVNGLTARTITKHGGAALNVGDMTAAGEYAARYNLANTRWELKDPRYPSFASTTDVQAGTSTSRFITPDSLAALWEAGGTITDTATPTIGDGGYFQLNGGTTITAIVFTVDTPGRTVRVRINANRTITHNAASLILPGGVDIQAKAGDLFEFRSLGSGNVIMDRYTLASGKALVGSLTLDTVKASTSGTSVDFTAIPAWARKIIISLRGVSTSGTSEMLVQLGDSDGFETTGYVSTSGNQSGGTTTSSTAGLLVTGPSVAGDVVSGQVVLTCIDPATFAWVSTGVVKRSTSLLVYSAGDKATSAALDRVRITTVGGSDTFDAGAINIMYE